jgi:hypothetical protein
VEYNDELSKAICNPDEPAVQGASDSSDSEVRVDGVVGRHGNKGENDGT